MVRDLAVFDDGSGPSLFAIGDFTGRIARWDGTSWHTVGGGLGDGFGRALCVHDDGTGPALYAAGTFRSAGGALANRIARWRGTQWEPVGAGLGQSSPAASWVGGYSLLSHAGRLYVGGTFSLAGESDALNVTMWDGVSFHPLGQGLAGSAEPTVVSDLMAAEDGSGGIIAAGTFTRAGSTPAIGLAVWDGKNWSQPGAAIGPLGQVAVNSIGYADIDGVRRLVAGGRFCQCRTASHVAVLREGAWSPLGGGVDSVVRSVCETPGGLLIAGDFSFAGDNYFGGLARFERGTWQPVSPGPGVGTRSPEEGVHAMALYDDGAGGGPEMYIGGSFHAAGPLGAGYIARWDGTSWREVGGGLRQVGANSNEDGVWDARAFDDGHGLALFVSGLFNESNQGPVRNIARWDGSAWSALGPGSQSKSLALAVYDNGTGPSLYATGSIPVAEGGSRLVARWDGVTWHAVGGVITGQQARAMAVYDDHTGSGPELYVAGRFTAVAGSPVMNVAKWNGQRWAACADGLGRTDDLVHSLEVVDLGGRPTLVAMGSFSQPSGLNIRRWTGAAWVPIGSFSDIPYALAKFDDGSGPALLCGSYARADYNGDPHNALWKLEGLEWQPYLGGTYGDVRAFLEPPARRPGRNTGRSLWIGGAMDSVGNGSPLGAGIRSSRVAKLIGCALCPPDWDGDSHVSTADFFLFLEEFFAGDADFDHNGATNSADFFVFVRGWFAGC
jgi:hypothetical protein